MLQPSLSSVSSSPFPVKNTYHKTGNWKPETGNDNSKLAHSKEPAIFETRFKMTHCPDFPYPLRVL
jgi:hypothetical protein